MKTRILAVAAATAMASGAAQAASFGTFDPRSMGMGGIGTSAGSSGNAAFYNPALLGPSARTDLYSVELPIVGLRVADPYDMIGAVEDTEGAIDDFEKAQQTLDSLENFDPNTQEDIDQAISDIDTAAGAIGTMSDAFGNIDNRPVEFEAFGGALIGMSATGTGMSIHAAARGMGGFRVDVDSNDTTMFSGFSKDLDGLADHFENGDPINDDYTGPNGYVNYDSTNQDITVNEMNDLQSSLAARGAVIQEIGLSLARDFTIRGEPISFGLTPKYLSVSTFDFSEPFEEADFDVDNGTKEHTAFDFDLGVAKLWDIGGHDVRTGLIAKNLMGHSFDTALGNSIDTDRQFRVGVSHHTDLTTVGLDLDLTENQPLADGFDQPTQFLGLGGEFTAWRLLDLRLGYRTDLAGSYEDTVHAGIGLLSIADVGAAYSDEEIQVSVRTGFRW